MKSKLIILSAALILALVGCNKNNDFKPADSSDTSGSQGQTVAVESVSVNPTSLTMDVDEVKTIAATVLPETATNKKVNWSVTGDEGVVLVDNGSVTAKKPGNAVVTATTEDGGKTASCNVTVNNPATPVNINNSEEGTKPADTWVYWNDQDYCGSTVNVSTHTKLGNTLSFAYEVVKGQCDWGFQVFYKNSQLATGASYRLTAKINSQKATSGQQVKINGTFVDLVAGDNNIAVKYVEGGATASSFQMVVNTTLGNNSFTISDWAWEGILDIPGEIVVNSDESKITFSNVDGAANYLVKYYNDSKEYLDQETVAGSGATLTKLPASDGNYYVSVQAISSLDPKYDSIPSELVLFKVGDEAVVPAGGPKTNIGWVEEKNLPLDKFCYWNDQNWCGSKVDISEAFTEEGQVTISYTATGACLFGLQVFYLNSSLTSGSTYNVKFKIKSSVAGDIYKGATEDEFKVNIPANEWTEISYDHTEAAGAASLKVCIPAQLAASNTILLKDFSWTVK